MTDYYPGKKKLISNDSVKVNNAFQLLSKSHQWAIWDWISTNKQSSGGVIVLQRCWLGLFRRGGAFFGRAGEETEKRITIRMKRQPVVN